jgi:hypothetical protein
VSDNGQQSTDPVEATTPVAATTPAVVDSHGIEAAKAKMRIRFGAGREIKKLPQHLWDDETVELLFSRNVSERNGLLALTSHRLIFLFAGLVNSAFEDFPISNISSISYKSGMALASIRSMRRATRPRSRTSTRLTPRKSRMPSARSSAVRPQRRRFKPPPRMPTSWPSGRGFVTPASSPPRTSRRRSVSFSGFER